MVYKPGQSGNPTGRPVGAKDKRHFLKEMIAAEAEDLIKQAIQMARDGNDSIMKVLLDRVLPAKPRDEAVNISLAGKNYVEKASNIVNALETGEMSPSQANDVMNVLSASANLHKIDSMETDIQAIKTHLGITD